MERRRHRQAQALRSAVAQLAPDTRAAMLAAVQAEELIVGAYTDRGGRACPMLAAYRRGARSGVGTFPRAWDAFARAKRPRAASERELEILEALLQESLDGQDLDPHRRDEQPEPVARPALPEGSHW